MRIPRRLTRLATVLALASAFVVAATSPAHAATHSGNHCTKHAWGAGTVVWTCASIHMPDGRPLAAAHGEARRTNGPSAKVRITSVRLYQDIPNASDRLIHAGPATPWETDHAYSHSEYCSFSFKGYLTATVYALVGVDASNSRGSFHWTVRSYNVNLWADENSTCYR
jgi:hypothetical protein